MLRPHLPVYDSMLASFFFLPSGTAGELTEAKLVRLSAAYRFLVSEYSRVRRKGLLGPAITAFRGRFQVGNAYTDGKVIDTLIWKFAILLRSGVIRDGAILYR